MTNEQPGQVPFAAHVGFAVVPANRTAASAPTTAICFIAVLLRSAVDFDVAARMPQAA